jgi:3-deoxy-D-manno-octulosonate 8-phosphate phosphatase (KDO 8-P phosphatase)
MSIDPQLARRIRFVGFDVDGVLTDGGIYLGAIDEARRLEFKRYDIQDGIGMEMLRIAGLRLSIVTGRVSESVALRARELGIEDVSQDKNAMKLAGLVKILKKQKIDLSEVAFIGDDFPDMPIMRLVGLPVAVGNAVPEIRSVAKVQLQREGGRGAVREFSELFLKARGEWDRAWNKYVDDRSHPEGQR